MKKELRFDRRRIIDFCQLHTDYTEWRCKKSSDILLLLQTMSVFAKRFCSIILLILFGWYITPKEVFHAFVAHHDSRHTVQDSKGLHISSEHHHCELLKADQQFSSAEIEIPFYIFTQPALYCYTKFTPLNEVNFFQSFYANHHLRGPPFYGSYF